MKLITPDAETTRAHHFSWSNRQMPTHYSRLASVSFIQVLLALIRKLFRRLRVQRIVINTLKNQLKTLSEENSKLKEKVQQPEKNSKNSSNSSSRDRYPQKKPPELDENGKPIKGKPGAKDGHKAHHRKKNKPVKKGEEATAPDLPTEEIEIKPEISNCSQCGEGLIRCPEKDHHKEQIEFVQDPIIRTLYTFEAFKCPHCNEIYYGEGPKSLGTGLLGPSIIAWLLFVKTSAHVSFTGLQQILKIFGLIVSRGFLSKVINKSSHALDKAYDEIKDAIPGQSVLNIDETSHKENGKRIWTWIFRSPIFAFFAIRVDRSASVLVDFLGEKFRGIIGCDYYSAYQKFIKQYGLLAQFCLAHLKRDIQFLVDHIANKELSGYGQKLMNRLNEIFDKVKLWRRLKGPRIPDDPDDPALEGEAREAKAQEVLEELRELARKFKEEALDHPDIKKAKNIAERFRKWPDNFYFTFLTDEGIAVGLEPTNNSSERTIRGAVLDRKVTQGTRSINGRNRCERVWSVMATCAMQGRSAYKFILDSIKAHFCGQGEHPSLLDKKDE